jgi:Icc-related predicted phosphoesterase
VKIFFTSDIHAHPSLLEQLRNESGCRRIDALIIGGDIIPHTPPRAHALGLLDAQAAYLENTLIPVLQQIKARQGMNIYLDLGNDDFAANRSILEHHEGELLHLLHMQKHALNEHVDVLGYMNVPPTPFRRKDWEKPDSAERPHAPGARVRLKGYRTHTGRIQETMLDLDSDDTMEADLHRLSARIRGPFIFVAHCPPWGTPLDLLSNGHHAGSLSIRRFVERWSKEGRMLASLHGHIHESPQVSGTAQIRFQRTLCINPGQKSRLQFVILEVTGDANASGVNIVEASHA